MINWVIVWTILVTAVLLIGIFVVMAILAAVAEEMLSGLHNEQMKRKWRKIAKKGHAKHGTPDWNGKRKGT